MITTDKEYVNDIVYAKVAAKNKVWVEDVESVMNFIGTIISDTIVADDPKVSVKLDFMGNFFSKPGRRKRIEDKRREEKENGTATTSRWGTGHNAVCP